MTGESRRAGDVRIELCVRSLSPVAARAQQAAVLNRLERLEAVGRIDDYSVSVWGSQLAETDAERSDAGRRILESVERFRDWADAHEESVELCFETEPVDSRMTGESYTQIVFPTMTLAEYGDDEVRLVRPCERDGTVETVTDRLDALEATSDLPLEPPSSDDRRAHDAIDTSDTTDATDAATESVDDARTPIDSGPTPPESDS